MKSEVFKELIEEAYGYAHEVSKEFPSAFEGVFIGRYTELIMERAINLCLNLRDPENPESRPGEAAAAALKQHFGIIDPPK